MKLGKACILVHQSAKPVDIENRVLVRVHRDVKDDRRQIESARLNSPAMNGEEPLLLIAKSITLRPFSRPPLEAADALYALIFVLLCDAALAFGLIPVVDGECRAAYKAATPIPAFSIAYPRTLFATEHLNPQQILCFSPPYTQQSDPET